MTEEQEGAAPVVHIVLAEPDRPELRDVAMHLMVVRDLYQFTAAAFGADGKFLDSWPFYGSNPDTADFAGRWPEPLIEYIASGNSISLALAGIATAMAAPFVKLLVICRDWKEDKRSKSLANDRYELVNVALRRWFEEHSLNEPPPNVLAQFAQVAQSLPAIPAIEIVEPPASR